jgi:hypothetical protein
MGVSLPSRRVVRVLNELVAVHGRPTAVRVDNGPEFTAQPFVDWCAEHGVATHYIQPGRPDQNAYIERFNRSYRTEVLNAHLFGSIAELRALTNAWLRIYNSERPPTTASAGCRRSRFCRGHHRAASLLSNCQLDGEAYELRTFEVLADIFLRYFGSASIERSRRSAFNRSTSACISAVRRN